MLGHRHEFYVGEPHPAHVIDEFAGEATVTKRFPFAFFTPGTEVQLIDAHGLAPRILPGPLFQPFLIAPCVVLVFPDNRSGLGRDLEEKPKRIRLLQHAAVTRENLKFVMTPHPATRRK